MPEEAGFPVSADPNDVSHVILQVHYNNPGAETGHTDSFGVTIHMTDKLRQHDAASLVLGDPTLTMEDLEPLKEVVRREGHCPSQCTANLKEPITIFSSLLHMVRALSYLLCLLTLTSRPILKINS